MRASSSSSAAFAEGSDATGPFVFGWDKLRRLTWSSLKLCPGRSDEEVRPPSDDEIRQAAFEVAAAGCDPSRYLDGIPVGVEADCPPADTAGNATIFTPAGTIAGYCAAVPQI